MCVSVKIDYCMAVQSTAQIWDMSTLLYCISVAKMHFCFHTFWMWTRIKNILNAGCCECCYEAPSAATAAVSLCFLYCGLAKLNSWGWYYFSIELVCTETHLQLCLSFRHQHNPWFPHSHCSHQLLFFTFGQLQVAPSFLQHHYTIVQQRPSALHELSVFLATITCTAPSTVSRSGVLYAV